MCSFWGPDGTWDWSQDANQRWVLLAARDRGACHFEAFSNSAPYWMTYSGRASGNTFAWLGKSGARLQITFSQHPVTQLIWAEHLKTKMTSPKRVMRVICLNLSFWRRQSPAQALWWLCLLLDQGGPLVQEKPQPDFQVLLLVPSTISDFAIWMRTRLSLSKCFSNISWRLA